MALILASTSPRRRELLALIGLAFSVVAIETDEARRLDELPPDYARRLSREKAQAAADLIEGAALMLAADTIVVDGSTVLGKPRDAGEAAAMLRRLRGRTHRVFTAVALLDTAARHTIVQMANSPVTMRAYTDEEIAAYVASGDPFDKAGAYAIQNADLHPVEHFDHCFANVMGLPLCHVTRMLRQVQIDPSVDVPAACQAFLSYSCPVAAHILAGGE